MMNTRCGSLLSAVVLGILLAGIYWTVQGPPGGRTDNSQIVVTEAVVAHERARWVKQWGRQPTEEELRQLLATFVRSETLYREALTRGMDRNDPRVRLALIQKMQMLASGRADAQEVNDADVSAFYGLRKDQYLVPGRLSLMQVFFSEGDESGPERARNLLEQFRRQEPSEAELRESGDASMLANVHRGLTEVEIERLFGTDFAASVSGIVGDVWSGPVRSPYGWHLVKVTERTSGRVPELAEVYDEVKNDLLYEARKSAEEQGYLEIAGKYRVLITDAAERLLEGSAQ